MPAENPGPSPRRRKRKSEEFLRRSRELFLREAPARVETLWAAGKSKDLRGVAVAAHTLACLAGNIDAAQLRDLAKAAERAAECPPQGTPAGAEDLPAILYDLEIAYAEIRAGLQRARELAPAGAAGGAARAAGGVARAAGGVARAAGGASASA